MQATKRLTAIFLALLLSAPAALAQEQPRPQLTAEVQILLQPEQVRFTAPPTVEQMRLQIYAANGELVFDSQPLAVSQLTWLWLGADGQPVKSGLYAYTLTIKAAGAAAERVRRGHFIVDRAHERDAQADRVWLTSQAESGSGTEVTVAHNEGSVLAGARTVSERPNVTGRETAPHKVEEEQAAPAVKPDLKAAAAALAGTVGRLAKFTTATEVGDSVITETGGNIGIGTASPLTKFQVVSGANDVLPPRLQSSGATSFAAGWDFYHGATPKGYVGVPNASAAQAPGELVLFGSAGTKTSLFAGGQRGITLDTNGNVGIGTATPTSKLEIAAQNGLAITGYQPYLTLRDTNSNSRRSYIQGVNGDLVFIPQSFSPGGAAMVIKDNNGSVGIGTSIPDPNRKLEIVGSGATAAGIKSTNDRAFLSLTSALNGQTRTWSVESGVYGLQDTFGIYNWQTGKAVLVDPNGQLTATGLRIAGGADFAEHFDVNTPQASKTAAAPKIEAGLIVSIDPAHPGKLSLSRRAYDRRVAGIISGAGGVKPGVMMAQEGTLADGQHPVALSGRVYVWADATRGAIKPGDLLTTSATPGHAKKALNPARAQGAIIGKAMTELKSGKGLVLVLVGLW
jgi:hypothetical protein